MYINLIENLQYRKICHNSKLQNKTKTIFLKDGVIHYHNTHQR